MKMNLRKALHMCELRTMPQGHPDYRFICQEMWRKIQEVHPALAEAGKFIDWQKYRLGRLQSEMRERRRREDPVRWTLDQLKTRCPSMVKQAGYEEIAEKIDQQAIANQLHPVRAGNLAKY